MEKFKGFKGIDNQLWGIVETEGDDWNINLQVLGGLSRKQNNPQLLAYYTTNAMAGIDNTTFLL